jgi:hypothetical protein
MTNERVIDYRSSDRYPEECPVCHSPITLTTQYGEFYAYGPADLSFIEKYGITTEGPVKTIWYSWECSKDSNHESGPVLIA